MWELLLQMTNFVLSITPDSFNVSFDQSMTVGSLRRCHP